MAKTGSYLKLFAVVAFMNCAESASPLTATRIIGGLAATIDEFPYQVSVRLNGMHWCGGSIISPTHIVTAAHCVIDPGTYSVQAGSTNASQTPASGVEVGQIRALAKKPKKHPEFKYALPKNGYDVALLTLAAPLVFGPTVQAIMLAAQGWPPPARLSPGATLLASGWGSTADFSSGLVYPEQLQKAYLEVVSMDACRAAYGQDLSYTTICTNTTSGKGTCSADSGGPLTTITKLPWGRVLVGVTSFADKRACVGVYPNVFTRITSVLDFIKAAQAEKSISEMPQTVLRPVLG